MPASTEQREWVQRVLGFDPDDPAEGADAAVDRLAIWRDAKETVDARLSALARSLRAVGDPDFDRIAEFGLFGLTDGETVALNKALREYGAAPADKRPTAAKALRAAVAEYRAAMASEGMFALLDENPFGVAVASRATLGVALDAIERSLP